MRIGINAQLLSLSQNYRNGGVSRYISYLVTELARKPGKHEYIVFVNGQEVIQHLEQHVGTQAHMTYVAAPWPESRPSTRIAWEQMDASTPGNTLWYRRVTCTRQCATRMDAAYLCNGCDLA